MARQTLASDNFNRASLGTDWTWITGVDPIAISASTVVQASVVDPASDNIGVYTALVPPNDQWCQVEVAFVREPGFGGLGLRWAAPDAVDGYMMFVNQLGASATINISKFTAGTLVALSSGGSTTGIAFLAATDLLSFEAVGSTLTGYVNGIAVISGSDSTHTAGRAALEFYATSALDDLQFDNFLVGDFSTAGWGPLLADRRGRLVTA